jgi:hypothetical protein
MRDLRSTVAKGLDDSDKPPPEANGSASLGEQRLSPGDACRDQARPSPGFTRPPARIRIVGPNDSDERVIEIPAIPSEPERVEFDELFANDDEVA